MYGAFRRAASKLAKAGATCAVPIAFISIYDHNSSSNCLSGGEAYAWGSGGFGQTGHGVEADIPIPRPIEMLRNRGVVQLVTSGSAVSSAALTEDGTVYVWGCGRDGRLGLGEAAVTNQDVPVPLSGLPKDIASIAIGEYHGLAVTRDGKLYGWGKRAAGTGKADGTPAAVALPAPVPIVSVACGREHSVAIDAEGGVWSFGVGSSYALGHGNKADAPTPQRVASLAIAGHHIVKAAAGREHTLLLTSEGSVLVAGTDSYGQCGLGHSAPFVRGYAPIGGQLASKRVVDISCGEYSSAALCDDGSVLTWGFNKEGGLGHGDRTDLGTPRLLEPAAPGSGASDFASAGRVVSLSQGGGHALLLTSSGRVFAVGRGRSGQLGRGDALESVAAYRTQPVEVTALSPSKLAGGSGSGGGGGSGGKAVVSVAAGRDHSLALVAER